MDELKGRKVLLSGASGFLGVAIRSALRANGATVVRLVRRETTGQDEIRWNPATGEIASGWLEDVDFAVHLSGANVAAKRWSPAYKAEIRESRVQSTEFLSRTLAKLVPKPRVLVTASAVGFYGNRGDEVLDENSPAGRGFFPELCAEWEVATRPAEEAGVRVVHLRFGMVIGRDGAMAKLAPLFRLGLGGPLGDGRQWISWVSESDAAKAALFAVGNDNLSGPVNVTAPEPITNAEFTRELGRAVHRPAFLRAPVFALRLAFGEMADEALLASTCAIPRKLTQAGFAFAYPTLARAFAATL